MNVIKWNLQLFADGGAQGAGQGGMAVGNTGVSAPDAGEPLTLEQPRTTRQRERARRRQQREGQQTGTVANVPESGSASPGTQEQASQQPAPETVQTDGQDGAKDQSGTQNAPEKPSFAQLIQGEYKQDFDKQVHEIIKKRFKDDASRAERDGNVNQLMTTLAQMLGQRVEDPEKLDPVELKQALLENQSLIDAAAMDAGVSSQQYRAELEMRSENALMKAQLQQQKQMQQENAQEQQRRQAFMQLQQEAQELKKIYPELELAQLLADNQAMRAVQALQIAGAKDPVRTIYEAKNRDRIMGGLARTAAQQGMQKVANAVAANQRRPDENGMQSQGGILSVMDVRNLSKEQRKDIKRRVRAGERIEF